MITLLRTASRDISKFLEVQLPKLSPDWWTKNVVDRLSFQQQRFVNEKGIKHLSEFDFAALLRILDQNWFDLSSIVSLPREARSWVKELQSVRNKWAHLGSSDLPANDLFRDADTLERFLLTIGACETTLKDVELVKSEALNRIAEPVLIKAEAALNKIEALEEQKISDETRDRFNLGDLVTLKSAPEIIFPVIDIIRGGSETRYSVFQNSEKRIYYESQLQPVAKDDENIVVSADELKARMTSWQVLSKSTTSLYSMRSGRVQFVPYQYRPVMKLIKSDKPRILIADEVGVGKTIEAGLIIKELCARMDIKSVLIICPKALVAEKKWFTEMKRFDEYFVALDGPTLRHCLSECDLEGEWPESHSKAILPFSLFDSDMLLGADSKQGKRKNKGLTELEPAPQFDLVIVDEAHHIRNSDTFLHQGVRTFCDNAQAVVLMTATPVQLGSNDLFTLLNVIRPDLVIDQASFEQMAAPNKFINGAIHNCRALEPNWQLEAREQLLESAATDWGRLFLRESPEFQKTFDALGQETVEDSERIALIQQLEELYTFSPMINRTRRRDIGDFTIRKPETVFVNFTHEQQEVHDKLLDIVGRILGQVHGQQNVKFMMTTIRRQAASCLYGLAPMINDLLAGKVDQLEFMEATDSDNEVSSNFIELIREDIDELLSLVKALPQFDPKIEAFKKVLIEKGKLDNNKSLVFTTFRHTLTYLLEHVSALDLRIGLVHGGILDDERAELRHRFSLPKDDPEAIDVLLSSEVGCEGLDFQFCDMLVNYDLPWNPMRIEQRIGRIDRYGQKSNTVAIINLVTPDTVDGDIYERCLWRIGVFQRTIGGNEEILGTITQEIHEIAESFTLSESEKSNRLQQLSDNSIRQIREEEDLEAKQSELFGLELPQSNWREVLDAAESCWLSSYAIEGLVSRYLADKFASDGEHVLGSSLSKTLRLNQDQRNALLADFGKRRTSIPTEREWEKWLKGSQPTLSITFDQETAAENLKNIHISVLHPLVRQAAKHFNKEAPLFCAIETENSELGTGTFPFAIYRWSKHGVRNDEQLVAISEDARVESVILSALPTSNSSTENLPNQTIFDGLDVRHHTKWVQAQAEHIESNRQLVSHRIQSLSVSHKARTQVIEDQINRTTNEKIKIMRKGELARAQSDYERRMKELELAAESGDIRTIPIIFGTLHIKKAAA